MRVIVEGENGNKKAEATGATSANYEIEYKVVLDSERLGVNSALNAVDSKTGFAFRARASLTVSATNRTTPRFANPSTRPESPASTAGALFTR